MNRDNGFTSSLMEAGDAEANNGTSSRHGLRWPLARTSKAQLLEDDC